MGTLTFYSLHACSTKQQFAGGSWHAPENTWQTMINVWVRGKCAIKWSNMAQWNVHIKTWDFILNYWDSEYQKHVLPKSDTSDKVKLVLPTWLSCFISNWVYGRCLSSVRPAWSPTNITGGHDWSLPPNIQHHPESRVLEGIYTYMGPFRGVQ